jgi:membrane-bound lytic murein transglycosylase D
MRSTVQARVVVSAVVVLGGVALTSCATAAQPQRFRTFFLPPSPPAPGPAAPEPLPPPPDVPDLYVNALPAPARLPNLVRTADVDVLIRQADDRFAAGKRAFSEGRLADARRDFNRSIQTLLSAPESIADRSRLERRLEELTDQIYQYDLDQMSSDSSDDSGFEKRPLDDILDLTFPIDPTLRGKVKQQVSGSGSQLPLEENDAVVGFINFFTSTRGRAVIESGLRRSGRYRDMILRVLAEEGLPQELIFLAQAESGFFPRAISYAQAAGMWQFVKFRGREYGLEQTPYSDDRLDPEKATRAAARHLKDLYNHFGDWYLAMAAYNCGPNCVDAAVARTGYADFWTLRRLGVLPAQTANYVPAILAMTILGKNAPDYNLNVTFDDPLEYDSVHLTSSTSLALVAAAIDVPVSSLKELNPALLRATAPAGYVLHLPKGTVPLLEAAFEVIPETQRNSWRLHKVEPGDTLASLARRYGATLAALSAANHGELPEAGLWAAIPVSYPGDRLVRAPARPASRPSRPAAKTTASAATRAAGAAKAAPHRPPSPQVATKNTNKAPLKRSGA